MSDVKLLNKLQINITKWYFLLVQCCVDNNSGTAPVVSKFNRDNIKKTKETIQQIHTTFPIQVYDILCAIIK
jgi:hypothetical protein